MKKNLKCFSEKTLKEEILTIDFLKNSKFSKWYFIHVTNIYHAPIVCPSERIVWAKLRCDNEDEKKWEEPETSLQWGEFRKASKKDWLNNLGSPVWNENVGRLAHNF